MMIEESSPRGPGFSLTYHAQAIRDAIELAHKDGFTLDDGDENEIQNMDLNGADGYYVRIIQNDTLLRDMVER